MKKNTLILFVAAVVITHAAVAQTSITGRWIGTWGNGTSEGPNYFSFMLHADNRLDLLNNSNQTIATGTYSFSNNQLNGSYTYTGGGTFSVSAALDGTGNLRGSWGSGSSLAGGKWVMTKQQTTTNTFVNTTRIQNLNIGTVVTTNITSGNTTLSGQWVGTWGNGSSDGPNYFSFRFNGDNTLQMLNNTGGIIANGTYSFNNNQLHGTYTYTSGGTYSIAANRDAAGVLRGTWGSGTNVSGGGSWVMSNSGNTTTAIVITPPMRRICVDRIISTGYLPDRNFSAVKPVPKINSDGSISQVGVIRQPLAGETNKMWDPGATINVFLENTTSSFVQSRVRFYAAEWEKHANIKFRFVNNRNDAQIKVGFDMNDGKSWSQIGKDVLFNPFNVNTMNFGWFSDNTEETEFRRTVIHEFGHALGFIHEHQSPVAGIQWDKEKVYKLFAEAPNRWSRGEVDVNIFNKYSRTATNFSAYDRSSIMHYFFPAGLTTDGSIFTMNTDLSAIDKQHVRNIYPFPPTPSNSSGTLRTGDDCDEVAFSVEYNRVASTVVEFVIQLGTANGRNVTWWKQVGIPRSGNTETFLWVQNHSLIQSENRTSFSVQIPVAELDASRGISFWKAKFLGVHTLLGYKWNVMPCLTGGSRVVLIWNKDSCN
jgi:hypothetical protein